MMANNQQQIDYFNRFLSNSLSAEEREAFLDIFNNDQDFKTAFELHQDMLEGIKRFALRTEIQQAYLSYRTRKYWKYFGFGMVLIGLLSLGYLAIQYDFQALETDKLSTITIVDTVGNQVDALPLAEQPKLVETVQKAIKLVKKPKEFTELYASWRKKPNVFRINPVKDTVLMGKEGTKIAIKANSFQFENGKLVKERIKLSVSEYYTKQDFIKANLGTTSNGKLLESGGMLYIEANVKGEALTLRKPIELSFKDEQPQDNMYLFSGNQQEQDSSDVINWKLMEVTRTPSTKSSLNVYEEELVAEMPNEMSESDYLTDSNRVLVEQQKPVKAFNTVIYKNPNLGWINCDRFYNTRVRKTRVRVQLKEYSSQRVMLIFDDINSMMNGRMIGKDRATFENVPIGMNVIVLAIAYQDGQYYMSTTKSRINNEVLSINYQEVTEAEINNYLSTYN